MRMLREGWRRHWKGWIAVCLLLALAAGIGRVVAKTQEAGLHRVVFQVNSDDPAPMKHAISNSINLVKYYRDHNEKIEIEIVAYGPGLAMFRSDKSPVKPVLDFIEAHFPEIGFAVCGNTKAIQEQQEGHPLSFIEGTQVVPFGIVELVKRQEAGWSYIRP